MSIRNITEVNVELIPEINIQTDEIISNEDILSQTLANYTTSYSKWVEANTSADENKKKRETTVGGQSAKPNSGSGDKNSANWFVTSNAIYDGSTINFEDANAGEADLTVLDEAVVLTPKVFDNSRYPMELELNEVHYIENLLDMTDADSNQLTLSKTNESGVILNKDGTVNADGKVSNRSGQAQYLSSLATEVKQENAASEMHFYTDILANDVEEAASSFANTYHTPNIWSTKVQDNNITSLVSSSPFVNAVTSLGILPTLSPPNSAPKIQVICNQNGDGTLTYKGTFFDSSSINLFLMGSIKSEFYLRKNQPFAFYFNQKGTNQYIIKDAKNRKPYDTSTNPTGINIVPIVTVLSSLGITNMTPIFTIPKVSNEPNAKYADVPSNDNMIMIEWGTRNKKTKENKFCLVFDCKMAAWSLYVEIEKSTLDQVGKPTGKTTVEYNLVDGPKVLEGIKAYDKFTVMVYPIGNKIILSTSVAGKDNQSKRNTISFDFGEAVFAGESKLNVYMYGAIETVFKFMPIYHAPFGLMASNFKNYKTKEPTFYFKSRYLGGVGLSPLALEDMITYPVTKDKKKLYEYLSPTWINYTFGKLADAGYTDLIDANSKDTDQLSVFDMYMVSNQDNYTVDPNPQIEAVNQLQRYYSPAIYSANLMIAPPAKTINLIENGETKLPYVRSVNISQTVEGYSGSVTLYNKSMDPRKKEGTYTNDYRLQGIKPIKIEARIKSDAEVAGSDSFESEANDPTSGKWNRLFTGYLTSRNFSRSSGKNAKESTLTLTLEDATIRAKDTYVICMPPFDGYCHLSVFYYLAKYAGYSDDEILLWQDYYDPNLKIRICDQLSGGKESANVYGGGCFDGHVDGFPRSDLKRLRSASVLGSSTGGVPPANSQLVGISGEQLHACLPMTLITESPGFFFQMGTTVWSAMQEVCEFTNFYLFANNWGNLIYCPPELAISPFVDFQFVEMPGDKSFEDVTHFNEILQNLAVDHPTAEVRNACMTQGLLLEGNSAKGEQTISPISSTKIQDGWPNNIKDENYVPWLRWIIQRNPHWNDLKRLEWNNEQTFMRASRKRSFGKWSAWGRGIFPYQILQVSEPHLNETGMNGERYICSSVNHVLDGENMQWNISIDAERYENKFEFSPSFK